MTVSQVAVSNQRPSDEEVLPGLSSQSAPKPVLTKPGPVNFWQHLREAFLVGAPSEGDSLREDEQPEPGSHVLLAAAWPAKLPKGKAMLSQCLLSSFGISKADTTGVLVYKVSLPACKFLFKSLCCSVNGSF